MQKRNFSLTQYHQALVLGAATAVYLSWTAGIYAYSIGEPIFLNLEGWVGYDFVSTVDVTFLALQEHLIPIVGIIALTLIKPFQRTLHHQAENSDRLKLGLLLIFIQTLFFLNQYRLGLSVDEHVGLGFLAVTIAGLIGGRQLGVAVGVVTMLLSGLRLYALDAVLGGSGQGYVAIMLTDAGMVGAIWLGFVVGTVADWPSGRRFHLLLGMGMGIVAHALVLLMRFMTQFNPVGELYDLPPRLLANGAGLFLLLLWLRYLQERERPFALTKQELELVRAELRALRSQINPHFLFNSLSVIHHLIRTQPEQARELLLDLSDMMQHTLQAGEFIPLQDEIAHVMAYLALEKARLTERLQVVWQIDAEIDMETAVPTLILQPIIENAIIHGIAPQAEGGTLKIILKRAGNDLIAQIGDNGAGFDVNKLQSEQDNKQLVQSNTPAKSSIGLKNVDQRLQLLYGEPYRLDITSWVGVGTTVIVKIPLKERLEIGDQGDWGSNNLQSLISIFPRRSL